MKFLYVALVVSLVGCAWSQPFDGEENIEEDVEATTEEHFYVDDPEFEAVTEYITNSTLDNENSEVIDPVNHRFGNGPSATVGSSCVIPIFEVERTEWVNNNKKNKFGIGKQRLRVILTKASAINGNLMFEGKWIITLANNVRNIRRQLVVKQTATQVVKISRIYIIEEYGIALLKVCRKITRIPFCDIDREQVCPTSICAPLPRSVTMEAYRQKLYNPQPDQSITSGTGDVVPCPQNRAGMCCFRSRQTICQSDAGGGVFNGRNIVGLVNSDGTCQPQDVVYFTALTGPAIMRVYRAVTTGSALDCENCANLPLRYPEFINV